MLFFVWLLSKVFFFFLKAGGGAYFWTFAAFQERELLKKDTWFECVPPTVHDVLSLKTPHYFHSLGWLQQANPLIGQPGGKNRHKKEIISPCCSFCFDKNSWWVVKDFVFHYSIFSMSNYFDVKKTFDNNQTKNSTVKLRVIN